jgi:D-glycero-alpha-D-manno-heptose-7-phosphate kinase
MTLHARAPLRIDFAGGWSDVPVFADAEGGRVVNAAIDRYVHVEVVLGARRIRLHALDLDEHVTLATSRDIRYDGTLDLHKAALNMLPVTGGIEILTRSDAPGGSGLGASGALDVALLAVLAQARNERYAREELAELGYLLETSELGLLGGRQDQYAAALGGCHRMESLRPRLPSTVLACRISRVTPCSSTRATRTSAPRRTRRCGARIATEIRR